MSHPLLRRLWQAEKLYSLTILWPPGYDPPSKKRREKGQEKGRDGDDDGSDGGELSGDEGDAAARAAEAEDDWAACGGVQAHSAQAQSHSAGPRGVVAAVVEASPAAGAAGEALARRAAAHALAVRHRSLHAPAALQAEGNKPRHESAVRAGAMMAGAAAGGAVVGAFTMGFGLIPYMAIVGGAAAVGGVAMYGKNPVDHRLVLAAATLDEARRWKVALEAAVATREGRRPQPVGAATRARGLRLVTAWGDPRACSWHVEGYLHGLRVLRY